MNTKELGEKIVAAIIPFKGDFHSKIEGNADFYVPFWTYVTISLLMIYVSNIVGYLKLGKNYRYFNFEMLPSVFITVK